MSLKKPCWIYFSLLALFCASCASTSQQVVTEDTKSWARKALKEEKSLQTLRAENTVAVIYFHNKTGQTQLDPLQKGMALMLITDLSGVKGIQVVERVKLQALLAEMDLGISGLVEPNTAPRVGGLLGARWLVGGTILESGTESLQVHSSPLEVPTQKILGQPMVEGKLAELFRIEKDLLFEIIKLLKIELKPDDEVKLRIPCSTKIGALLALFRAIGESDRGDFETAAQFYRIGLKEDPQLCVARGALWELKGRGLIGGQENPDPSPLFPDRIRLPPGQRVPPPPPPKPPGRSKPL